MISGILTAIDENVKLLAPDQGKTPVSFCEKISIFGLISFRKTWL